MCAGDLLEHAAAGDLPAFRAAVAAGGDVSSPSPWYSRRHGATGMGSVDRTPAMIAALYGNVELLAYILSAAPGEASRASPSDGATPLHCAAASGAVASLDAAEVIVAVCPAAVDAEDSLGRRPGDVLPRSADKTLRVLLKSPLPSPTSSPKYPGDATLPDLNSGLFITDEFRMYSFKIKPCSRAYSHDWAECPFAHPGENARRRDVRKYSYSCVPCPEFRKTNACRKGDACEYAHGVFESWLHPAQYRTRLCKDEVGCKRRICFFAHRQEELRTVNPAAMSVGLSPPSWLPSPVGTPGSACNIDLLALNSMLQNGSWSTQAAAAAAAMRSLHPPVYADLLGATDQAALLQRRHTQANNTVFDAVELPKLAMGGGCTSSSPGARSSMNARAAAFAKRSQSFIDRSSSPSCISSKSSMSPDRSPSSVLSDWGSPDGKLDWGIQTDELRQLRKSASFGLKGNRHNITHMPMPVNTMGLEQPNMPWMNSLLKDENRSSKIEGQLHGNAPEYYKGELFPFLAELEQIAAS